MESQKIPNCQSNREENEQSRRHNLPRFQKILQIFSNQNNVLLTQKQAYGSMEQNRKPKNKPTYLRSINLQQRRQKLKMEKRKYFRQVAWEGWIATCTSMKSEHHTQHTQK